MLCADGRPLATGARVRGLLEIGGRIQEESFIVADIEAAAILGAEFLKRNRVTVDMARTELNWGVSGLEGVCRVVNGRDVMIPGGQEIVV